MERILVHWDIHCFRSMLGLPLATCQPLLSIIQERTGQYSDFHENEICGTKISNNALIIIVDLLPKHFLV